jgi:hypothetical protein
VAREKVELRLHRKFGLRKISEADVSMHRYALSHMHLKKIETTYYSSVLREVAGGSQKTKWAGPPDRGATLSQSECDVEKFRHLTLP